MMQQKNARLTVWTICVLILVAGCDPVRSIEQSVTLKVSDATGNPISDCKVEAKLDTNEDAQVSQRQSSEDSTWKNSGVADEDGTVEFKFVTTLIDKSTKEKPNWDPVKGKQYRVRVDQGGWVEFQIEMSNGKSALSDGITITVVNVADARYVPLN